MFLRIIFRRKHINDYPSSYHMLVNSCSQLWIVFQGFLFVYGGEKAFVEVIEAGCMQFLQLCPLKAAIIKFQFHFTIETFSASVRCLHSFMEQFPP